jgi:hypothetical protein
MRFKLYTASAFISLSFLFSCAGNDNTDYTDRSLISPASEKKTTDPVVTNTVPGTNPVNITPTITQAGSSTTQSTPVIMNTQTAQQTTAPGMNPPHGQPNHRCDIAVGAPLNSKPAPVTTQATTQTTPVTIQEVQQKTAPGMNPPHGQPNHRCDIAVGAPLNSKPLPATTQATNTTTQITPVTTNTQTVQQTTAPGMNPPHGQPNHRCDIAVGAPLNSKPAVTEAPKQATAPPALIAAPKSDSGKS